VSGTGKQLEDGKKGNRNTNIYTGKWFFLLSGFENEK
jgi:hypothetical protein